MKKQESIKTIADVKREIEVQVDAWIEDNKESILSGEYARKLIKDGVHDAILHSIGVEYRYGECKVLYKSKLYPLINEMSIKNVEEVFRNVGVPELTERDIRQLRKEFKEIYMEHLFSNIREKAIQHAEEMAEKVFASVVGEYVIE